jgi:hypothetical protein
VVKDQTLLEWTPYGTSAVIDHFNLGRNIYGGLFYTRNLSLDAPRHIAESNGADIKVVRQQYADDADLPFLPGFLEENKEHYHVLPARDEVDGVPCWVVEWEGMDRFWIDPARGFAVPRRQFCWAPGKPLNYEFLNQDYREVKAGLWLPFTQIENKYASIVAEKESLWGKVAARSEYRLHNIEFDSVPDSLFEVKLPAGTHVIDMVRDFQYAVSGNNDTDPFADEIEEARREISLMTTPTNRHRRWFLIVNLFIGAAAVAAWLYRRWPRNAS